MRSSSVALLALAALAGCNKVQVSPPKMDRVNILSNDGSQNVSSVMRLINELCVSRSTSSLAMAEGLKATGWQWQQTQQSDPSQPLSLDLWKSPPVQVIRGNLAGEQVTNCMIAIEGAAAPEPNLIAMELSKIAKHGNRKAREWSWRSSSTTETHIELMDAAFEEKAGITVTVENFKLPWWRSILGN
jgi:hypothetical protein